MPIYEYQCSACNHQVEIMQKMSDAPVTECMHCHQPTLVKLISAAGFQLKGTGWYATDYSTKAKEKTATEKNEKPAVAKEEPKKNNDTSSTSTGSTS